MRKRFLFRGLIKHYLTGTAFVKMCDSNCHFVKGQIDAIRTYFKNTKSSDKDILRVIQPVR